LQTIWLRLIGREAFRAVVFEESEDSPARLIAVGVSVFVSDDFLLEMKTPPFFWVGPELVRRLMRGESPLLSDKEMRKANTNGGLNLVVWEGVRRPEEVNRMEVHIAIFSAFVEQHRGFLLKELIGQGVNLDSLEGTLRSGGMLLGADGSYTEIIDKPMSEVIAEPHYVGITRELALCRFGTWIGSLFVYQPPQFGFRPSEQRLLLAALQGGTDEDIAETLKISLSAVKKTWRSIYDRVTPLCPGLIADKVAEESNSERGKEKKQRMLAYLREHPEELRPASL
jgi:DNA-binding CsgD family transcriptional regulator